MGEAIASLGNDDLLDRDDDEADDKDDAS
jgi:hypothetical protein